MMPNWTVIDTVLQTKIREDQDCDYGDLFKRGIVMAAITADEVFYFYNSLQISVADALCF